MTTTKIIRPPCPDGCIEWNTGRSYTAEGQYIRAGIVNGKTVFFDCSRGLCGEVDCNLDRWAIMAEYDAGRYQHPRQHWLLPELLGLVPRLVRSGVIGGAESWREFRLFSGVMSEEDAAYYCQTNGIQESYAGPGRTFAREPRIIRTKRRTLIVQSGGLDI